MNDEEQTFLCQLLMGKIVPLFGDRILEERKRLGMNQEAVAGRCEVTLRSQRNYEKGERHPDAAYLERLAAIGVDVLYVLTGRRAPAANGLGVSEPGPAGHLTLPELGLIKGWRQLDAKGRQAVLAMMEALTQGAPGLPPGAAVQTVAGRDVKQITTGDINQGNGGRIG